MLESNIAAEYNKLPNEKEKIGYERGFIENFSKSFKEQKAGFNKFTNWRMLGDDKDPRVKVVACDGAGKDVVFLFYIAHDGRKRKLIDFKIVVPKAEWDDLLKQKGAVDNVEKQ